jgi:hypothetical protein
MRRFPNYLIVAASLAMCAVAGQASAGQARQRSAPPSSSRGPSGSSSQSSQPSQSDRGRSQTQSQRREAPQQQTQRQIQQQPRNDARSNSRMDARPVPSPNSSYDSRSYAPRGNDSRTYSSGRNNDNRGYDSRAVPQRQAVPAPRDRYIDQNRNGRDDRYDSGRTSYRSGSFLGGIVGGLLGLGRDGRYNSRYTPYFGYSSSYRYDDYRYGSRIYIAPRNYTRFSSSWFSFRPYSRLAIGLTMGYPVAFPTWYDPYVVGSAGYARPSMPYGGVTFDVEPRDADLWVDGDYIGPVSDYTSYDPPLTLVAGRHHIELAVSNDRALSFDITVVSGQVIPYQGTLPYYR